MRYPILAIALGVASSQIAAADAPVYDARIAKLEQELHAVQRKVFANGVAVEPEIPSGSNAVASGSPASSPVADLTQRVDLLEAQIKTLTGQNEQFAVRLKHADDMLKGQAAQIKSLETPADATAARATPADAKATDNLTTLKAVSGKKLVADKTSVKTRVDSKRQAEVDAIPLADSADEIENSYTYGYRLFAAKLYPEAEAKFTEFMANHPKSKRASYAQNLLGRAYLEEGKNDQATRAFVENYTKLPRGERAAESLSWAGVALIRNNMPSKACRVYQEFDSAYGQKAAHDVLARVAKGRIDAKCAG